jgi:nitrogen regulatory protein PII
MKRIEAVITPSTLDSFKEAAFRLGISEFELVEVYRLGCETIEGANGLYRGSEYTAELSPRLRVEFVMFDDDVQKTLHGLLQLVHPESISVFRLDQEVRTIPSAQAGARRLIPVSRQHNQTRTATKIHRPDLMDRRALISTPASPIRH